MSRIPWSHAFALTASLLLPGQSTHLGIPAGQCLVLEGIVTSSTERKWTLYQGGIIQPSTASPWYRVPSDKKMAITDVKFILRGQVGKSANVGLSAKQGVQNLQFFRLTARLLAGLDQNVTSEHFSAPMILAEGTELTAFVSASNNGVVLEGFLLYGYFLPAGN